MSEAEDRIKNRDTPRSFSREILEESLVQMFKEKFDGLAPCCGDRIVPLGKNAICVYHTSNPVNCRFSICPKLDLPFHKSAMIEASSNLKRRKNHG